MKKNFYKTMYRLLAGATRRVNWRWLNEWKVAMGISLITAGHTAAGKEATAGMGADVKAPEAIHADTLRLTLRLPDERAKEEDALLISDPEMDAKPLFLGNWREYFQGHLSYPPEALEEGTTGRVYVQFTIGTDGSIGNARVTQSVCPVLDKEVLRAIREMPPWASDRRIYYKPIEENYVIGIPFV